MVQQICKGKTYTRRNDIQHIEHQKHDNNNITYSQRQTRFGEEQTKPANSLDPEKLGPEEEGQKRRDCTARQQHDEHNNITNGILYKEEKEDGTIITSANLSGSQFDFEFMLDHCKGHIMLIQEHWRLKE
eukprot:2328767-Heterocapsa_arctica.AAC.1